MAAAAQTIYANDLMYQKFIHVLMSEMPDVYFIFEEESNVVKLPAHKKVLAASSKVFDVMFNGPLKEKGDVKIVDASSTVFKDFLQLFYGQQVTMRIDTIVELMKLIDKYDVADCIPNCVNFLKTHLKIDDILWGLHLAIKFRVDDLKAFCSNEIQKNFNQVWKMFDIMDDGKVKLPADLSSRFVSEEDVGAVFQHVFGISKDIASNYLVGVHRYRYVVEFDVDKSSYEKLPQFGVIQIRLSEPMLLTDIFCLDVFSQMGEHFSAVKESFEIFISKDFLKNASCFDFDQFRFDMLASEYKFTTDAHVELVDPIKIESDVTYTIIIRPSIPGNRHTYRVKNPSSDQLKANVKISFPDPYPRVPKRYTRCLVSHLHFSDP